MNYDNTCIFINHHQKVKIKYKVKCLVILEIITLYQNIHIMNNNIMSLTHCSMQEHIFCPVDNIFT